jgi:hypothetical protein
VTPTVTRRRMGLDGSSVEANIISDRAALPARSRSGGVFVFGGSSSVFDEAFVARFWARVDRSGDCWVWTGSVAKKGYGLVKVRLGYRQSKSMQTHRVSFALATGAFPAGMVLHHCDNPPCVRPDHLYAGTAADNAQDRKRRGRGYRPPLKTHCPYGHPYERGSGRRLECRPCKRARNREYYLRSLR